MKLIKILLFALICFLWIPSSHAQFIVSGTLLDPRTGESLPQANINASGKMSLSDLKGRFKTEIPTSELWLEINYIGFLPFKLDTILNSKETDIGIIYMQEDVKSLGEVTITSGKFRRVIEDVTVSIETVKPHFLEKNSIRRIDDLLEKVSGVNYVDGQVSIRGGTGFAYGAGSRVMVLVDNMPALQYDTGYPNWNNIPTENIGQVEVLKGAGSALYGSAAMNGVINILTTYARKEPVLKVRSFTRIYDNPADTLKKWWTRSPLTSGFSTLYAKKYDKLDVVASVFFSRENSYRKDWFSDYQRATLNLSYQLNDFVSFGVRSNFNSAKGQDYFYWQDSQEGAYIGNPGAYTSQEKVLFYIDPFISYMNNYGTKHLLQTRYYSVKNLVTEDKSNIAHSYYSEYQFQKNFLKFDLVMNAGIVNTLSKTESELYGDTIFTSNNTAAYLQFEKRFFDRLSLIAGARYEYNDVNGPKYIRGQDVSEKYKSDKEPVFRFGANYRLFDFTNLRASWGQGFRYPTVAEKFINTKAGNLVIYPNPDLGSETGYTVEIGLRQGLKLGNFKGFLDLSAFQSDYNDMIEFVLKFDKELFFTAENIGNTRIRGAELAGGFSGEIGKLRLDFTGGYTSIDPKYRDFNEEVQRNLSVDYNILKYRYKESFKLDIEIGYSDFFVGFGSSYNSFMEAVDKIFEQDLFFKGVKEYRELNNTGNNIFRFRTGFKYRSLDFQLNVDNLFNREYSVRPGLLEAPRSYTLTFGYNIN